MNFPKTILVGMTFSLAVFTSCQDKQKKDATTDTTVDTELTLEQKQQQLQMASPSSAASNVTLPPGSVNPPHGEPGHRCDIPVGAPLDGSAPQQSVNVKPVEVDVPPANPGNTGPKPATNPEHGQPWHRCDIKVGEPLP
ncbi:MAG TPA: hypothetical protein VFF21_06295 [Flavobacteriaceae bacterium]|nr:hypothetical protein [Flavobacteriaceae bacterium]